MRGPVPVWLTGPAEIELTRMAAAAAPREVGGVLLGWWDNAALIVRHSLEVADRRSTRFSWTRRPRATKSVLEQALGQLEHPWLGYVGDWHSHPEVCGASGRDEETLAATSGQYHDPVALIVHLPNGTFDVRVAHHGHLRPATLARQDPRSPA